MKIVIHPAIVSLRGVSGPPELAEESAGAVGCCETMVTFSATTVTCVGSDSVFDALALSSNPLIAIPVMRSFDAGYYQSDPYKCMLRRDCRRFVLVPSQPGS